MRGLKHLLCGAALLMAAARPGMVCAQTTQPAATMPATMPAVLHLEDAAIVVPAARAMGVDPVCAIRYE